MWLKRMLRKVVPSRLYLELAEIYNYPRNSLQLRIDNYLRDHLYANPVYAHPSKLNRHEFQVYSQHGEDGLIDIICQRLGITTGTFVEFGVGDGLENNTTFLLAKDWKGYWIEADADSIHHIEAKFAGVLKRGQLKLKESFITAENIESLFSSLRIPDEFDLLSMDINGNDYWVWRSIVHWKPKIVVIEYNSQFPPPTRWVKPYDPKAIWDGTMYFGTSLKALELLGSDKGYTLVACNFIGMNAFFVRTDLIGDRFVGPFTAEHHYEPPRWFLYRQIGHRRNFGEFTTGADDLD